MQTATEINNYIQPLRGKNIRAAEAIAMFPELEAIYTESVARAANPKNYGADAFFVVLVGGSMSFSTWSYDDASDFLLDNPEAQGFQFSQLTGLSVCADQSR